MAGLFGIGGSAAKTDRKQQLSSWGNLGNIAGTAATAGKEQLSTGTADVNKAKTYWQALMSGDPTAMSKVLAPQISTIQGQTGQQVRGIEQFSGRSGGTSGAVEAVNAESAAAIQNLFDLLGPEAASEFTKLAGFEVGTGEELLGLSSSTNAEVGAQASNSRQITVPQQQGQQSAVIQTIGTLMGLA